MSRRELVELGSSPHGEDCAQVGQGDYEERARRECRALRSQLERHAQAHGVDLTPVRLVVKSNAHDFGCYYEVAASYDVDDEAGADAAYWLEANMPESWDDEARVELGLASVETILEELQGQVNALVDNHREWSPDEVAVSAAGLQRLAAKLGSDLRKILAERG